MKRAPLSAGFDVIALVRCPSRGYHACAAVRGCGLGPAHAVPRPCSPHSQFPPQPTPNPPTPTTRTVWQAIVVISVLRHSDEMVYVPAAKMYLLTLGTLAGAGVSAFLAGGQARAAYVRCLEVTAFIMRLQLFGMACRGAGWQLTW